MLSTCCRTARKRWKICSGSRRRSSPAAAMRTSSRGTSSMAWPTMPAWFIRRFVDAKARFRFADPATPKKDGEVRFDMVGGDFTHEEDRCTFETLVGRVGLPDKAVRAIAEIVHDLDLKDAKFARAEAAGVRMMLDGL